MFPDGGALRKASVREGGRTAFSAPRLARNHRGRRFFISPLSRRQAPENGCLSVVGRGGFEPPKSKTSDLQSDPFGRSGIFPYEIVKLTVEPVTGIEPATG